ncbi:protein kinase [Streptomyces sp. A1-5]|uniref:protein kinase n=1 Tax=Streptomyces sp. A1-5 TaxID=2738410 RepID=UPI001F1EE75B|nr:protein kinase [Streptomyces sp. A1-5]UJB42545.1 protein kinase [Streptomyces sp. A1-5]
MDEYAGRVLAERYRLPARPFGDDPGPAADAPGAPYDASCPDQFGETRAFDTYSGQEVLIRQVPLPEVVDAELLAADGSGMPAGSGADGHPAHGRAQDGFASGGRTAAVRGRAATQGADRSPRDPVVQHALQAATAAAQLPDHPLLDQVFDVFAQDGSLWIVGELLPARPLSALLAARALSPHRAAEIAVDLLTALRALHAHGWLHRNITARTVLVCDDGRAILTGLAVGAAQEALCGYDPVPEEPAAAVSLAKAGVGGGAAEAADQAPGGAGPTGLAAERARQARLQVVGAVTERWAPEQAGPADGSAAPVGPAADLWAVGALLFRAVQGHPPYPEESAAELVRWVRAQPPAEAAEGGALRPVIGALLCQDPAGRPAAEELRDRLRALVRTAPEPDLGRRTVALPALAGPADPRRLPILRRRGELVRRGRPRRLRARPRSVPAGRAAGAPPPRSAEPAAFRPARSARSAGRPSGAGQEPSELLGHVGVGPVPPRPRAGRGPRSLGRVLLTVILLLMVAGIAYAVMFLPKSGADAAGGPSGGGLSGTSGVTPGNSPAAPPGRDGDDGRGTGRAPGTGAPRTTASGGVAAGFALRTDPAGFQIAVREGWQRGAGADRGQVRYTGGDYELLVVPGRDTTARFGPDPMAYQQDKEPELAAFRASGWSSVSGLRRIDVGQTAMAEGAFTWKDGSGRQVYARNLAMIRDGRYHCVLVIGPDTGRTEVDRLYTQASSSYRPG